MARQVSPETEPEWRGDPLPRGRHKLGPDEVRASQRERLLRAMLECVAVDGIESTTVTRVARAARVSPNAFYVHFPDKFACFAAASDVLADELVEQLAATAVAGTWQEALRAGMAIYLRRWAERPEFARAYLLSSYGGGEQGHLQRERVYARFCLLFQVLAARARAEQPELAPLLPIAPRALVVAITDIVAEAVRAGATDRLGELEDQLVDLAVRLLGDPSLDQGLRKTIT